MSGIVVAQNTVTHPAKPRVKRGRPSRTPKTSVKKTKIDEFTSVTKVTTRKPENKKTEILNEMRIRYSPPAISIWEDFLDSAINNIEIELTESEYHPTNCHNMIDWYANNSDVEMILAQHREREASRCGQVFEGLSLNISDDVDELVKLSQKMLEISQKKIIADELTLREISARKPDETDRELLQRLTQVNNAISFFIDHRIIHEYL